ncbi:hypothetical protein ACKWTF_011739 [Chironomus riparius]
MIRSNAIVLCSEKRMKLNKSCGPFYDKKVVIKERIFLLSSTIDKDLIIPCRIFIITVHKCKSDRERKGEEVNEKKETIRSHMTMIGTGGINETHKSMKTFH